MKANNQHRLLKSGRKRTLEKLFTILAGFILLLSSCATPPVSLRVELPTNPTVAQVLQAPDNYKGTRVRWGGVIYKITNLKSETELEIVSRNLDKQARPKEEDYTYGRFLADIPGFLEPSIFAPNREITVVGVVTGTVSRSIDEFDYNYPVINVETFHLWEPRPTPQPYDYWWRYDPWYWGYPWYPWYYPYPY